MIAALVIVGIGLLAAPLPTATWRARAGTKSGLSRRREKPDDLAGFLDAVARQVRSGDSLAAAVLEQGSHTSTFGAVSAGVIRGMSIAESLDNAIARSPDEVLTLHALRASARLGGPIAATLDGAAHVLRERAAARDERRAHAAQARLSARVLTGVPIAFAAWNVITSSTARSVYFAPVGTVLLGVGVVLNLVGWRWMTKAIGR